MKQSRAFVPHKVVFAQGIHGSLIRGCTECGCTWKLVLEGSDYAWSPILEMGPNNIPLDNLEQDITYCFARGDGVTQTQSNQQVIVAKSDERKCYCSDCYKSGRKEHYDGETKCYCVKCRGNKVHKIA
jgi:hypothetical protein